MLPTWTTSWQETPNQWEKQNMDWNLQNGDSKKKTILICIVRCLRRYFCCSNRKLIVTGYFFEEYYSPRISGPPDGMNRFKKLEINFQKYLNSSPLASLASNLNAGWMMNVEGMYEIPTTLLYFSYTRGGMLRCQHSFANLQILIWEVLTSENAITVAMKAVLLTDLFW